MAVCLFFFASLKKILVQRLQWTRIFASSLLYEKKREYSRKACLLQAGRRDAKVL